MRSRLLKSSLKQKAPTLRHWLPGNTVFRMMTAGFLGASLIYLNGKSPRNIAAHLARWYRPGGAWSTPSSLQKSLVVSHLIDSSPRRSCYSVMREGKHKLIAHLFKTMHCLWSASCRFSQTKPHMGSWETNMVNASPVDTLFPVSFCSSFLLFSSSLMSNPFCCTVTSWTGNTGWTLTSQDMLGMIGCIDHGRLTLTIWTMIKRQHVEEYGHRTPRFEWE